MSTELYKKYRPKSFKTMIGQTEAIKSVQRMIERGEIPHAFLVTGPSGCGKTTLARIMRGVLNCGPQDFFEVNSADFKGIDMVRDIRKHINFPPMSGESRIWLIDEAHKLTGDAQEAFLKILEDTPKHAYFFLCTTNGQKLIEAIHTRCSEVRMRKLSPAELTILLEKCIEKEQMKVDSDVVQSIVEASEGSARKALVILQQVGHLPTSEQEAAITATTINKDVALQLALGIVYRGFPGKDGKWKTVEWNDIASMLRKLSESDAEGVRYIVLGMARNCLIGKDDGTGKNAPKPKYFDQAFKVIDIFGRNFYDSKAAGLAAACWEAVSTK